MKHIVTIILWACAVTGTLNGWADQWDPGDGSPAGATLLGEPPATETVHAGHTLSVTDESDWFRFTLREGMRYLFFTTGEMDTWGEIVDGDGETVLKFERLGGEGLNFWMPFVPERSGIHYLRIFSPTGAAFGNYALHYINRSAQPPQDDPYDPADGDPAGATPLPPPGVREKRLEGRTLSPSDLSDWFALELAAGAVYSFAPEGHYPARLALFEPDGATPAAESVPAAGPLNAELTFVPPRDGVYYLRVRMAEPGLNGSYALIYARIDHAYAGDEWDPFDDSAGGATVLPPASDAPRTHGPHRLPPDDPGDWFEIVLETGRIYSFASDAGSNTMAELYGEDLSEPIVRALDSRAGDAFVIEFAAAGDGKHYLRVLNAGTETAGYTLTYSIAADIPAPPSDEWDPADNAPEGAPPLPAPGPETMEHGPHSLGPEDRFDWFRIELTAGAEYEFWAAGGSDTHGHAFGPDGRTQIAADDDRGPGMNFRLLVRPGSTGVHYLQVRMFSPGAPGSYTLFYRRYETPNTVLDAWDPADDVPSGATDLGEPGAGSVHGPHRLSDGDREDWFAFSLMEDAMYEFSSSGGAPLNGELYGEDGGLLATGEAAPGGDFRILYQPPRAAGALLRVTAELDGAFEYTLHYRGTGRAVPPRPTPRYPLPLLRAFRMDSADEFQTIPGGFGGAPAGRAEIKDTPLDADGRSDGRGVVLTALPGQVALLRFGLVEAGEWAVLIRARVWIEGRGGAPALAAADASLDGSQTALIPFNPAPFQNRYGTMAVLYDSPGDGGIVPLLQLSNHGNAAVEAYLDNLEVFAIPPGSQIPAWMIYGED